LGADKARYLGEEENLFSVADIAGSTIKEYGLFYLLEEITKGIGLKETLCTALPGLWEKVLTIAYYLVASGDPVMYCENWVDNSESLNCGNMSSQRISDVLADIDHDDRMRFYHHWGSYRLEQEYYALDTTSISSYSELIGDINWGHNRDREKLKQINVCMLMGQKSGLPIFQMIYEGSLNDVRTLKTTLETASGLDLKELKFIMDKGFYSKLNVDSLLNSDDSYDFLVAMPFTNNFAKSQVKSERKDIDIPENTIALPEGYIRGICKTRAWGQGKSVYSHIFFNSKYAYDERNRLYGLASELRDRALKDPTDKDYIALYNKFLHVRKSARQESGYTVSIRRDVIEKELEHTGWLVIISNFLDDPKYALELYRAKDCVEKGFYRYKNCLDYERTRVHSDANMQSKIFIGFIALIISSYIDRTMRDKNLYKNWTMKEMLQKLRALRIQRIRDHTILYPTTKEHKIIFEAFGMKSPS
jgi:hypothetical protein